MSEQTIAEREELARLITEEEKDDTHRVWGREASLDASLVSDGEFTLLDNCLLRRCRESTHTQI